MENKGIFKTSLVGGFEKESVLTYLQELNASNAKTLEEKQEELDTLEQESSQKDDEIAHLKSQLEDSNDFISKQTVELQRLEKELSAVKDELDKTKLQARKFENENILLAEKYKQLKIKHENLTEKEQNFNDASVKLGSLLLEAQKTAESIVQNANSKADEIKKETKREVRETVCKIEGFKNDFQSMKTDIQAILSVMNNKINDIEVSIDTTLKKSKKVVSEPAPIKPTGEKQNLECRKPIKI